VSAVLFAVLFAACALGLAWIDARRVALRDAMIARLDAAREADADEAAATYNALRLELETLRCGDLGPFFDDELPPERAEAFRLHLGTCETCQRDLEGHMQLDARLSALAESREPHGGDNG
jgi:hypothetical protein